MTAPDPMQTALSEYGAVGVFAQQNPELNNLLQQAVAQQWDAARFERELWTTNWYKSLTDAQQQLQVQQATDPATYNNNLMQKANAISIQAQQMGLKNVDATAVAKQALWNGWDPAMIQYQLVKAVGASDADVGGALVGNAGEYQSHIYNQLGAYGIPINDTWVNQQVNNVLAGIQTIGGVDTQVLSQAMKLYPQYHDDFVEGRTLSDIAKPYLSQMGTTLEIDPSAITLQDQTIQKALQGDGKNPTPLWQFNQMLKQDPRWQHTDNAKNAAYDTVAQIGKDWGFM